MNENDGWDEKKAAFYAEAICKMARLIGIDVGWNVASFPKGTCCGHEVKLDVSFGSLDPVDSLYLDHCLRTRNGILSFNFDAGSLLDCDAMMASFIYSWRFQVYCGSRLLCDLENPFFGRHELLECGSLEELEVKIDLLGVDLEKVRRKNIEAVRKQAGKRENGEGEGNGAS